MTYADIYNYSNIHELINETTDCLYTAKVNYAYTFNKQLVLIESLIVKGLFKFDREQILSFIDMLCTLYYNRGRGLMDDIYELWEIKLSLSSMTCGDIWGV